ncbi:MAG: hypothetical protein A3K19_03015, partial [Lentisphaerae bacterium RIFOXYB12_FULL_65_16]
MDRTIFANPPNEYRPAPFWSVNDALDPEELRRQVREFDRVGYGGWFFHPRVGIATKYLSKEWMDAFGAALDEGRRLKQLCWIYDEDSYPSGFAGGIVLREHPEYYGRAIRMFQGEPPADCRVLARFAVRAAGAELRSSRRLNDGEAPAAEEQLLIFAMQPFPTSGWFNGGTYVDMLNPDAVDAFLRSTHDQYAAQFQFEFGKSIPGVFTDEPHIAPSVGPFAVTWTETLEAEFNSQHGYSLYDRLPELFFRGAHSASVRIDYWVTVSRRFKTACIQRMADWCDTHGLVLTGHCWEHEFPLCAHAGTFNYAEAPMQWPGIDLLAGNVDKGRIPGRLQPQAGRIGVVKAVSGLHHQFGRQRIMSETYGGGGWDMTFRDFKELLDWECVLGVNYVVPHLSHYSLRGCRKRDYPPVFLDYSPWWPELRFINDYTARLCYALTRGTPKVDIAVLQPLAFSWNACPNRPEETAAINRTALLFEALLKELSGAQWEYDLVDELNLAENGGTDGASLKVGKAAYRVLIVPAVDMLYSGALEVICRFSANRGRILWVTPAPQTIDGEKGALLDGMYRAASSEWVALEAAALSQALTRHTVRSLVAEPVDGEPALPIYVQTRRLGGDAAASFWVNTSKLSGNVRFQHPGSVNVEKWDLLSGKVTPVSSESAAGVTSWTARVEPGESQLLLFQNRASASDTAITMLPRKTTTPDALALRPTWDCRLVTPNILVLDTPSYRVAAEAWSEPKATWLALKELRERFGMKDEPEIRQNRARRFYDIWANPKAFETVELRYTVWCPKGTPPPRDAKFVVESGKRFQIRVNDQTVPGPDGRWLDPSFTTFPIGNLLRPGANEVVLSTMFAEDSELETVYVIGSFGVWRRGPVEFELGQVPKLLRSGTWVEQGLPF